MTGMTEAAGPRSAPVRDDVQPVANEMRDRIATGLVPALPIIAVGVFGMCLTMAVVDGIWMTVIHTKVPHRFHARVLAVNQAIENHPVEKVGATLRGHMTAMKQIAVGG